jgi:hypothetical protein
MSNPPPGHSPNDVTSRSSRRKSLQQWRSSAREVTLAWNAWLAADRGDQGVRYRAFVSALAAEELAAVEVERLARPSEAGERDAPDRFQVRSSLSDEDR